MYDDPVTDTQKQINSSLTNISDCDLYQWTKTHMDRLEQLMNKHGVTATKECHQVITSFLQEYPQSNNFSLSQKKMFHTDSISRQSKSFPWIRLQNAVFSAKSGEPDEIDSDKTSYPTQSSSVQSKVRWNVCGKNTFPTNTIPHQTLLRSAILIGRKEKVCDSLAQSHISIIAQCQNSIYYARHISRNWPSPNHIWTPYYYRWCSIGNVPQIWWNH